MRSHYAITSRVYYYMPSDHGAPFDFKRWKDAPHIALANLRHEPEAVQRFTRTYGVLGCKGKDRTISVGRVLAYRDWLRRAWEGDTYNFFALAITQPSLIAQPTGMVIAVNDPLTLVQVMFAQDWGEGRLKKCENPDCAAPYFRAVRKGQKFCSQKCAVLINVRHFREREAALKAKGEKHAKAKEV